MLNSFIDRGMYNDTFGENQELISSQNTSSQNTSSADLDGDLEMGPNNIRVTLERKKYHIRN